MDAGKAMKNLYLRNLSKIEFVVTYACTGRCRHCSEGDHAPCAESIDPAAAAEAVRGIAAEYDVQCVMTFGGEPLLYPDAVCAVMRTASELGIPRRQVITNGYFSQNADTVRATVERLAVCGVNDLLLSVDAFHQETIPLCSVRAFAEQVRRCQIPIRLQPAWLVSADDDNVYNRKTREILSRLEDLQIPVGEGNVIFPEGNAKRYLAEYFTENVPQNPYEEDPYDVRCVSFCPNGDVLRGNLYRQDVREILKRYTP